MSQKVLQSLTDVELIGLESELSLADGHAAQDLDALFEPIIHALPSHWLRGGASDSSRACEFEFRDASARLYGSHALAAHPWFRIAPSASLSIDMLAGVVASRGGDVGLIQPTFDNIHQIFSRRRVTTHAIDDRALLHAIRTNAVAPLLDPLAIRHLFVVNPNNPTGRVLSADELTVLASHCRARHMTLLLDNSFRLYNRAPYDDYHVLRETGVSFAAFEDTGKVFPTQEKKASLLCYSEDMAQDVQQVYHEIYLKPCPPDLRMLSAFFDRTAEHGIERALWKVVDERRSALRRSIGGSALQTAPAALHSTLSVEWLDCSRLGLEDEQVCAQLQRKGLTILPGRQFFWADRQRPENHFNVRVSLLKPRSTFEAGLALLAEFAHRGVEVLS